MLYAPQPAGPTLVTIARDREIPSPTPEMAAWGNHDRQRFHEAGVRNPKNQAWHCSEASLWLQSSEQPRNSRRSTVAATAATTAILYWNIKFFRFLWGLLFALAVAITVVIAVAVAITVATTFAFGVGLLTGCLLFAVAITVAIAITLAIVTAVAIALAFGLGLCRFRICGCFQCILLCIACFYLGIILSGTTTWIGYFGVQSGVQGVPGEGGAFDPDGEGTHALEDAQFAELCVGGDRARQELVHLIEELACFFDALAFDRLGHHGAGGGADGAAFSLKADFFDHAVADLDKDIYLVAAEWIVPMSEVIGAVELVAVSGLLIVVEDDLLVEFTKFRH